MNEQDLDISYLVHKLLSGKNIFIYNDIEYYQINAVLDIKIKADFLYQQTYQDNLYSDGFVSKDYLKALLIENKIIALDHDNQVKKLEKKIEDLKVELYKNYKNKNFRHSYKKQINQYKLLLNSSIQNAHSFDFLLLDYYCSKIKFEYILSNTIFYSSNDTLVFDFNNLNHSHFNNIANYISNDELKSLDTLKIIARDSYWRNYWTANKSNIFGESAKNWSDEQRALVNLSNMYDSVYESMECPDEDIINDNDALDGWFIMQKRKRLLEKKEKGVDQLLGRGKNSGEVFLMANSTEDIEEITDMNSEESLNIYRSRIKATRSSERPIHEAEFADVKGKIIEELKGMKK